MNTNLILIILLILTTILYIKALICRLLGYKDEDEENAQKEDTLISNESYTNYSVRISSQTAHDIHFQIKLMRPIMFASLLLNIFCIPTLLILGGFVKSVDYDTFIFVLFGMFFVIGALAVILGYIKEKLGLRFMASTFFYLAFLCIMLSVFHIVNFK